MFRNKLRLLHQITNLILTLTPRRGNSCLIRKRTLGSKGLRTNNLIENHKIKLLRNFTEYDEPNISF